MGMTKRCGLGVALLILSGAVLNAQSPAESRQVTVAAAADLSTALKEVATAYQKKTGVEIKLSFGASGALTQQIENGAPFDVFFSADTDYPARLIKGGYGDASTLYSYAVGRIVLWVASDSPLDPARDQIKTLLDASVKKISIANPAQAPYGRAAVAVLQHYGVYEKVSRELVMGENISQAAQFVESGNAQAGFVALAHVLAPDMKGKGKYWLVPPDAYPRIEQSALVTTHSAHERDARLFLDYVKTADVAAILARYGFELPAPTSAGK
jgi:molybdate transport system substrate-binding protein